MENVEKVSHYQSYFDNLYGEINSQRDWHEIYGYLSRTCGYLTKNLVKSKSKPEDFIRPISWLFALASEMNIDLETSFLEKFPRVCPYCLELTCCCHETNKKPKKSNMLPFQMKNAREEHYHTSLNTSSRTFESYIKLLKDIYPGNSIIWKFSGPWMNCAKLFEEISELQEAIAKYKTGEIQNITAVKEEFADVLAWLLSAWYCTFNEPLSNHIKNYFYEGCPVCLKQKCKCTTHAARIQGVIDAEKFKELRNTFEELLDVASSHNIDMSDLIASLKDIETTQSETSATATISQAREVLGEFDKKIDKTDKVVNVLNNLTSMIGTLSSAFN